MTDKGNDNEPKARSIYESLQEAVEEFDEDLAKEIIRDAEEAGFKISLEQENEEVDWSNGYPSAIVNCRLKLGETTVETWEVEFSASFGGGGGTGWWIVELNNEASLELNELLEFLELEVESPEIPRPTEEQGSE